MQLSICMIGRNQAAMLPRIKESFKALDIFDISYETIYVDSASSDNTAEEAREYFDKVVVLEDSPDLNASAGRYIGTLQSSGDWILYLDGDMLISEEFIKSAEEHILHGNPNEGIVGKYRNVFIQNGTKENLLGYKNEGSIVKQFGGASMQPKHAVLQAGNWNPRLFCWEELDLHTRLRQIGFETRYNGIQMLDHITIWYSKLTILRSCFIPYKSIFGKKFYGFGQLIASRIKNKNLMSLVKYYPYPFVYFLFLFACLLSLVFGEFNTAAFLFGLAIIYVITTKNIYYIATYSSFLIQGLLGYNKYNPSYIPIIKEIWTKTE